MGNASGSIGDTIRDDRRLPSFYGRQAIRRNASSDGYGVMVKSAANDGAAGSPRPTSELFALATADRCLLASGVLQRLDAGPAHTLGARVRRFFAETASRGAPDLLVGALPFDRMADDYLFQPETLSDKLPASRAADRIGHRWHARPEPSRAAYEAAVGRALERISSQHGKDRPLTKIVLSRSLLLEADGLIDILMLFDRLGNDRRIMRFLTPIGPGMDGRPRHLIGATPELLIRKRGGSILSHPLAGSARRSADLAADRAAADRLSRSDKDRREHRWVVEAILDGLAPWCAQLSAPDTPALVSTRTMWHLGTRIEGQLRNPQDVSSAALAAVLHPTPAVGGTPREQAMTLIPELEGYDRGFYAGAVGWTDRAGDGEWYVSLRCAEVSGRRARVYAGAGIVEGSQPAAEADETSAKLQAILCALGVEEGRLSPEPASCPPPYPEYRKMG